MQKKKRTGSGDRSGDRFLHNLVSANLCGIENMKRDAVLDFGTKEHGSQHRKHFPHRSLSEMTAYLTWRDFVDGRKPDPLMNLRISTGHIIVDSLPAKMKERMKFLQTLSNLF
ncbi:MAG: hypothetical protein PHU34_11355 [Candidatus Methanoperedens sp.]|nr:hypothetical protein [Candidatus Methanoperedens sp.]